MKHSFTCPKCSSTDVVFFEGSKYNQASIVYLNRLGAAAAIDRYACTHCGFTEQWIQMDEKFNRWVEKQREEGKGQSDFV